MSKYKMIYNADDFCRIMYHLARDVLSLYVYGAFGQRATDSNKIYYTEKHFADYNGSPSRAKKIKSAHSRTIFADCVNLIKGVLWGLTTENGAKYLANGVPDVNANDFFHKYCTKKSNNFANIQKGEAVWKEGHIGVYIGQGCAVECTPIWDDGIQITGVANIKGKRGFKVTHNREWEMHGFIPWIEYPKDLTPLVKDAESFVNKERKAGYTNKEILDAISREM